MAEYDLSGINIPYRLDAEQSVLGIIIMDGNAIDEVTDILKPEYFHVEINRKVFAVMMQMSLAGTPIDIITLLDCVMQQGIFENNEQAKEYLTRTTNAVPSITSIKKYADIIVEKYKIRSLIYAAKDILDAVNEGSEDADTLIGFAEQKIMDIRSGTSDHGLTHIKGIVHERVNALFDLYNAAKDGGKPAISGLQTMFPSLDAKIYGLNRSDLIILAARPGMGKTSFAMNVAVGVAKKQLDKAVAVFSLEMSKEQIVARLLSSEASLSSDQMKTGQIPNEKWTDITQSCEILSKLNIYIDDTPGITVSAMKSKLRRISNLGLVVIDYLQLMSSAKNFNGNRVLEVSEITRNLKIMAKELNVPVITLSQLARGPEQRVDKRPVLSDLRDSGSIEQDADIVLFLYRNAYYDKTDPNVNACECIIAKNRHGETDTIGLHWDGQYTRFSNADYVHAE